MHPSTTTLLICASALSVGWWLPQLLRTLRHGAAGVSAYTWTISTANLVLWGSWALLANQPAVVAVEWTQAAGSFAVLCVVGLTKRTAGVGLVVGTLVGVSHTFVALASLAAVGSVLLVRLPQLWRLHVRPSALHQVSATTWGISALANLLWVGWGISGHHPTMIIGAGIAAGTSLAIAVRARTLSARLDDPVLIPA